MEHKRIVVLAGDGIGPEVTYWAKKVLKMIARGFKHEFVFDEALIGHAAIEATGQPLPEETIAVCKNSDGILLGAVGDPRYDNNPNLTVRPEQGLLAIRKELGLYCNLRPIQIFDELVHASSLKPELVKGADILFYRELTGGIYFGQRGHNETGDEAYDTMVYSRMEVERIARKAFEAAGRRRGRLHSVDKANVLGSSRLWRDTVQNLAKEYPSVELIHMFIDNAAMQLIRNPKQFDVVVTGNMFGDILTDEASQITGSLGMLPSASVGDQWGLYEPVHGSAPDIANKNIANPMASILSAAMLLEFSFGMKEESEMVIKTIKEVLQSGFRTADIANDSTPENKIFGTTHIGKEILETLETKLFQSVVI